MRRTIQTGCAALAAALALASGAQTAAAADPSCAPTVPPGTPVAVTAPQALAQLFTLTEARQLLAVTAIVADTAQGAAVVQVTETRINSAGLVVPAGILASGTVALPAVPGPISVPLPRGLVRGPGTFAIVVDPPGSSSAVAWTVCADESAGGARYRTAADTWVALSTRLAFAVVGAVPDNTAPETTITAAPPAYTSAALVEVSFTADDPGASFTCAVNGASAVPCASPLQLTPAEGRHSVSVRAMDDLGNVEATPAVASFAIDRTAPDIDVPDTVSVWATSATGAGSVEYDAGARDALDPAPSVVCSPPSGSAFPLGTTTVTCQAADAAGNVSTRTFLVVVRANPGRAEVSAQWNPISGRIQVTEPGGGEIEFAPPVILATRGDHVTRVGYRGAYEYKRGRLNTSLQLRSIAYDGAAATSLRSTFYAVTDAMEFADGTIRQVQITGAAGERAVVIEYDSTSRATRVMWLNGDRRRYETRAGLWVPRLRTADASAAVTLVRPPALPGGTAMAATGQNATTFGDALEDQVVDDGELAAFLARG